MDIPANYTLREKVEVRKLDDVLVNPESLHIVAVKMFDFGALDEHG